MSKFNHAPVNNAEESFRYLLKLDIMKDTKKAFIHNFKNLCHHSCLTNLFENHFVKKDAKVNLELSSIAQVVEHEDGYLINKSVEYIDAVAIELDPARNNVKRAYLMLSADPDQVNFIAELHVNYFSIGKVVYPVKTDNLYNTMLLAIGK